VHLLRALVRRNRCLRYENGAALIGRLGLEPSENVVRSLPLCTGAVNPWNPMAAGVGPMT
jgi:hypothetical protein